MERQLSHSQNFLKSPERVLELLSRTSIRAGDTVYDIGAGTGTITEALRRKVCNVIAIEIDKGLYEGLQIKILGLRKRAAASSRFFEILSHTQRRL